MGAKCPKCNGTHYILINSTSIREGKIEYRQCSNPECCRRYKVQVLVGGNEILMSKKED